MVKLFIILLELGMLFVNSPEFSIQNDAECTLHVQIESTVGDWNIIVMPGEERFLTIPPVDTIYMNIKTKGDCGCVIANDYPYLPRVYMKKETFAIPRNECTGFIYVKPKCPQA